MWDGACRDVATHIPGTPSGGELAELRSQGRGCRDAGLGWQPRTAAPQ